MEEIFDGFFSFFGFIENPSDRKAKAILKVSAAEKIKGDLKKINKDYRSKYNQIKKEVLCIE
jgi:hypothetical protein